MSIKIPNCTITQQVTAKVSLKIGSLLAGRVYSLSYKVIQAQQIWQLVVITVVFKKKQVSHKTQYNEISNLIDSFIYFKLYK